MDFTCFCEVLELLVLEFLKFFLSESAWMSFGQDNSLVILLFLVWYA